MSEPKLVSPLLDHFVMGEPISQHQGVRSCPAMQKDSENKYIVKIVSIPASQRSLDALLLAGAFPNAQAAQEYFRELADGVVKEAQILQQLSKLEGFVTFNGWQVEPMKEATGYEIFLLSDYRRSLERHFRREPMTHLAAVNLGLDLCAALAVCRRCGYLYVNLKPGNVYIGEDNEYRIGDLGFVALDSLGSTFLPDRYRSTYTAPEIVDAFCSLNATVDIYAVGLILYQAYNNGQLPFEGAAPSGPLPPPQYADYEMAQIILKACDPNPENRWEDPLQMGKALVSYMQRNSVNDVPIVPASPAPEAAAPAEDPDEELPDDDYLSQGLADPDVQPEIPTWQEDEPDDLTPVLLPEEISAEVEEAPAEPEEIPAEVEEAPAEAEEIPAEVEEVPAEVEEVPAEAEEIPAEAEEIPAEAEEIPAEAEEIPAEVEEVPAEPEEVPAEVEDIPADETLPSDENVAGLEDALLTDEVSAMLALADELIAHELPEPVVAPEPVHLPMPEPISLEEPAEEAFAEELPEAQPPAEAPALEQEYEPEAEEETPVPVRTRPQRSYKGLIIFLLVVAIGLSLFTGGYAFYRFYYLQTVENISLTHSDAQVTVKITSDIDDALLTVVCKDTYGNTQRKPVSGGKAVFDSLNPGTSYEFYVEISGLHTLVGKTKASLTTAQQTSILNLSIVTGSEDGSAILSFTVQGPDSSWQVVCSAEGETPKTFSCVDHTASLHGLTPGVTYQIQLVPASTLYVVGQESVTYTATTIIYAQDLKATAFRDNKLTVSWSAPEGATVESWTVRCYDNDKVDKTITVTGTEAVFGDLDPSKAYNIEVTAAGMTRSVTTSVSANTVNVYDLQVEPLDGNSLRVTWNFSGNTPEGGWRVLYNVDGGTEPMLVNCQGTSATLPLIPGSHYEISILQTSGNTILDGTVTYDTPEAGTFADYWLTAESLNFYTCLPINTPTANFDTVTRTDTFAPGAKASILMQTPQIYRNGFDEIVNLYVIRDSNGAVVSVTNPVRIWADMLEAGFGIIHLPAVPSVAGSYTVDIFFNGAFVASVPFNVSGTQAP